MYKISISIVPFKKESRSIVILKQKGISIVGGVYSNILG